MLLNLIGPEGGKRWGWRWLNCGVEGWRGDQKTRGWKWRRHGRHNRGQCNRRGRVQGRTTRRGTELVQRERGALALTLTLALGLAVLFGVLLHFGVTISGGIARRATTARWETRGNGARGREAQLHYVGEFAIWNKKLKGTNQLNIRCSQQYKWTLSNHKNLTNQIEILQEKHKMLTKIRL